MRKSCSFYKMTFERSDDGVRSSAVSRSIFTYLSIFRLLQKKKFLPVDGKLRKTGSQFEIRITKFGIFFATSFIIYPHFLFLSHSKLT